MSHNSSTLTMPQRLSSLSNTKIDLLISKMPENQATCRSGLLTEDGSKCGNSKDKTLSMRRDKLLMFKVASMLKTRISLSTPRITKSINNGLSYMLMKTRQSQRREKSTKTSVYTLRDHSILRLTCQAEDISTFLETMLSSRHQMVMTLRNGILTNQARPSRLFPIQANPLTSKAQENLTMFRSGTQTLHGGKSSNTSKKTSSTLLQVRSLMSQEERIKKVRT